MQKSEAPKIVLSAARVLWKPGFETGKGNQFAFPALINRKAPVRYTFVRKNR